MLGKGAYGDVYYAYDTQDKNSVFAVKQIDKRKIIRPNQLKRVQNEITLMQDIKSPHVVELKNAT
jgi:serine/threonine protein kinase